MGEAEAVVPQRTRVDDALRLLRKYLDNHCANADREGMSALCECRLCLQTREYLQIIDAVGQDSDDPT